MTIPSSAQKSKEVLTKKQAFSYAYGNFNALLYKERFGGKLSKDELNANCFVAGLLEGMKGEKNQVARSHQIMKERWERGIRSSNRKEAYAIAYHLGIISLGISSQERPMPISDFEEKWLVKGFEDGSKGKVSYMSEATRDSLFLHYMAPRQKAYEDAMDLKEEPPVREYTAFEKKTAASALQGMTPRQKLSYAYGNQLGKAVEGMGLTRQERSAAIIATGFMQGLVADSLENAKGLELVKERLQSGVVSATKEAAEEVAYQIGLTSISPWALVVDIPASDFEEKWLAKGVKHVVQGSFPIMGDELIDSTFNAHAEPIRALYEVQMK